MNKKFFANMINKEEIKKKKQNIVDDFETDSFNTYLSEEIKNRMENINNLKRDIVSDQESMIDSDNDINEDLMILESKLDKKKVKKIETTLINLDEDLEDDSIIIESKPDKKKGNKKVENKVINLDEDLDEDSIIIESKLAKKNLSKKIEKKVIELEEGLEEGLEEDLEEDVDENKSFVESTVNINEYTSKNFFWRDYVSYYPDLGHLNTKEKAWKHWINYGKNENRIFFTDKTKEKLEKMIKKENEKKVDKSEKTEESKKFDWRSYVKYYPDLNHLNTKEKAWEHWIKHGKKEKRKCFTLNNNTDKDYEIFDWKTYINNYKDLKNLKTKMEAWNHWINHGKKEKRVSYDLNKIELENYEKIKKKESQLMKKSKKNDFFFLKNDNDDKKKMIFKNLYDFYGTHYYGWKGVINQFISYFQDINQNDEYKENIFFDEWIEKLLLWGNKIQSKEYIDIIKSQNCKLISFLHNPPCLRFKDKEYKKKNSKSMILNDEQMNKNIISNLNNELNENLEFLYVLSNDHKKNIYHNYPFLKEKVISLYHPIDLKMNKYEKEFNFDLFKKSKKIFHIGWWLRNFKTFIDFVPPEKFEKNILIKNDFVNEWNDHILKYNKVKNINIINELTDEEYLKIFEKSCIFIDLEDSVGSNIILECLKFNTPFITRYNKSIEEYVGYDYPLYFENINELELLTDENIFFTAVKDAHEYLKKMDKTHIELMSFNKKITYDLDKLKVKTFKYKLTWICILNEEFSSVLLMDLINNFIRQENQENLQLIFITHESFNTENLSENPFSEYEHIYLFNVDDPNECIKNLDTEYILMVNLNDKYKTSYSKFCIEYLDTKQNADVIFSTFKKITKLTKENEVKENKVDKYREGMYFIDDIENITLPNSGFIFRKSIHILIEFNFLFMENKEMYKYLLQNHLNVLCVSEKPLFITSD